MGERSSGAERQVLGRHRELLDQADRAHDEATKQEDQPRTIEVALPALLGVSRNGATMRSGPQPRRLDDSAGVVHAGLVRAFALSLAS
jgi:hypothetical protein